DAENNLRLKIDLAKKGQSTSASDTQTDEHGGLSLIQHSTDDEEDDTASGIASFKLPDEES
ncbi:MAG: hypothetical protein IMF14_07495, partial [Proteobacteria bacterium]|nr:hypothetical protein [Pseudomonadota bacterium]